MRSLILALFMVGVVANASNSMVSTQVDMQSTQQPLGIAGVTSSPTTQNIRSTIGLSTDKMGKGFSIDSRMILDTPDYSSVLLRNNTGANTTLNSPNKNEYQAELKLNWAKTTHTASASYFGHLSSSPFETRGVSLEFIESFFEKTTMTGIQTTYFDQKRPTDFFLDKDLFYKKRPTEIHAFEMAGTLEQVLNERSKILAKISTSKKYEERPRNYGGEIKGAYALTSRSFASLKTGYYGESMAETLQNERGYFSAFISQAELTLEPIYDFWVSFSYGLSIERENDPRILTSTQVAIDNYGMGLRYLYKDIIFDLQGTAGFSNALTNSYKVSGGISWVL